MLVVKGSFCVIIGVMRFSDILGVKILGDTIGRASGVVNPSEVDGDGDGFRMGRDGKDNVPVVADKVKDGLEMLKNLDKARADLEKRHGDLSKPDNVRRAFSKVFPNAKGENFSLIADDAKSLSAMDMARVVTLLHRGEEDPRTARGVSIISGTGKLMQGGLFGGSYPAVCMGGFHDGRIAVGLDFNPSYDHAVLGIGNNGGWGDKVIADLVEKGASKEDIDKFWMHYIATHEWSHAQHMTRALEDAGFDLNESDPTKVMYAMGKALGKDKEQVDGQLEFIYAYDDIRNGMDRDEALSKAKIAYIKAMSRDVDHKLEFDMLYDHLTQDEKASLSPDYIRGLSNYGATHFAELVAEKRSAQMLGYDDSSIPAWDKLSKFISTKADAKQDYVGCSGFPYMRKKKTSTS